MTDPLPCPVCGKSPDVDECGPPFDEGLGWYAGCYGQSPVEHYVGGNGSTKALAIIDYNRTIKNGSWKRADLLVDC